MPASVISTPSVQSIDDALVTGCGAGKSAGWLTLGVPQAQLGIDLPPMRTIEPRPGRLVLFPSTLWHGTVPFDSGERLTVIPVDVGNPHAVVRRDALSRDDLLRIGPALETHPRFPARTNVQLARPESRDSVDMLVWERGAGETRASGSSAAAVGAAAVARGWCTSPVRVAMPGGELLVEVSGSSVVLIGPAEEICAGTTAL